MRLILGALVLVAAVLAIQIENGGGDYKPREPADPCNAAHATTVPPRLEPLAERLVVAGIDEAACTLGVSRERLVLDLAAGRDVDPEVLRDGLLRGAETLDLPPISSLLPEALELADLPGLVQSAIEAIPDSAVDELLPTEALLQRAIEELDIEAVLADLEDPARLETLLRDAILEAAEDEIVDRLLP